MKPIRYYPKEILEHVCGVVENATGVKVYPGFRPKASVDKIDEMIIVSLPYIFKDHFVTQTSVCRFEILVRNKQNGIEPVNKLQDLLDKVTSILPIQTKRFRVFDPILALRGEDKVGFSVWNIQAELTVYTVDRFSDV